MEGIEVAAAVDSVPLVEGMAPLWPDESVESAFLAEARERGETVTPAKPKEAVAEEGGANSLPALDELVQRIPPNVREVLDDLFRARFVAVKRVPKEALK